MTPCTRYPDDEVVVRYVTGDLREPDLSAFEDHMFACDGCLSRVEHFQGAQGALSARELPEPPIAVPTDAGRPANGPGPRRSWWMTTAVAAGLVMGLAGFVTWTGIRQPDTQQALSTPANVTSESDGSRGPDGSRGLSQPADADQPAPPTRSPGGLQVAVLAMVTPPPYLPITTRGDAADDDSFRVGMDAYVRADWAGAARALRDVPTPQAQFYGGVADLMRGETATAVTALAAARDSGREPYARESQFYLGKAALQRGDVAGARKWFAAARDGNSTTATEAKQLLARLDDLTAATPE